jgi:hypothetical protein
MKREPWAIGNAFAHGIRILNCIFCRHPKQEGWTEDDVEASHETKLLVAEQVNYMCSDMMVEDAEEILAMVGSIPTGRLCEETKCVFHHPDNPHAVHGHLDLCKHTCFECSFNTKTKEHVDNQKNHFTS